MNGKSSVRTRQFRSGTSQRADFLSTFRQQMSDYARGEHIRDLRDRRHLSQEDVAHEVGVSTKTIRLWEKGGAIKWENAKRLAAFYEVEPDKLVTREATDLALTVADLERLKRIEETLDEILRRLPPPSEGDVPDRLPDGPDHPPDAQDGDGSATGTEG